jgi:hypothetical protein
MSLEPSTYIIVLKRCFFIGLIKMLGYKISLPMWLCFVPFNTEIFIRKGILCLILFLGQGLMA